MLCIADYGAFVVAIILFLMVPGPGNLALITATGKGGMAATLGGVAALLVAYPAAFHAVQWLGVTYLACLGAKMLLAKAGAAPVVQLRAHHYLRQAFMITLLNPKAIVFTMAFFPLVRRPCAASGSGDFRVHGDDDCDADPCLWLDGGSADLPFGAASASAPLCFPLD